MLYLKKFHKFLTFKISEKKLFCKMKNKGHRLANKILTFFLQNRADKIIEFENLSQI